MKLRALQTRWYAQVDVADGTVICDVSRWLHVKGQSLRLQSTFRQELLRKGGTVSVRPSNSLWVSMYLALSEFFFHSYAVRAIMD